MKIKKHYIFFMMVAFAALLTANIGVAEELCPDECTIDLGRKDGIVTIKTLPRNGEWPVPSTNSDLDYPCNTPGIDGCLAFPYVCEDNDPTGGDIGCSKFSAVFFSLHECCDNPIIPLSDTTGTINENKIFFCDEDNPGQNQWLDSCNSFTVEINTDTSAAGKKRLWFTTQAGVDVDMADIKIVAGGSPISCRKGIKGPGCPGEVDEFGGEPVEFITFRRGVKIKYKTNPRGCVDQCQFENDPARCQDIDVPGFSCPSGPPEWLDCLRVPPDKAPKVNGETVVQAGKIIEATPNPACRNDRFETHGSPGWSWNYTATGWQLVCLGYYYPTSPGYCCDLTSSGWSCIPRP